MNLIENFLLAGFWSVAVLGTVFMAMGAVEMVTQQHKPAWKCWGAGQFLVMMGYGFVTERMLEISASKHIGVLLALSLLFAVTFILTLSKHSHCSDKAR